MNNRLFTQHSKRRVKWGEVILFTVLTYGFTWLYCGPSIWPYLGQVLTSMKVPENFDITVGSFGVAYGMFGPMIAAIIMRLFVSKEGLKGTLGVWRAQKYYLIAFIAPPLFLGSVILFNHLTGLGRFVWSLSMPLWWAYLLQWSADIIPYFGFGEEYGWRGYLLPRLLPLGEVKASMILGFIWALWHLPGLVVGLNFPGQNLLLIILTFTFLVVLLSFPFTWLYIASRGSVLIAAILHNTFNNYADTFMNPNFIPNGNPLIVSGAGLIAAVFLLIIVIVVYGVFKRSPKVKNIKNLSPQPDGTWRDWLL